MEEKTKVYVGNLGTGVSRRELKRAFSYYGPLRTVWIVKNPPGFPFVEFEDPTHAEDAVQDLDGKVICGSRMRVELPTGMLWRSDFENRPLAQHSFGPSDKCGKKGHHAYDCHHYSQQRGSRLQSRSYLRSRGRRYSHSCSRSREKGQDQDLLDQQNQLNTEDLGLVL
ncbi:serine/arginine-rich splicing factor 7-like [Canis lupus familiaris]|uniref:serine/arginine-rich splicing factor 7-like n=1 Tax=Canis lupus familiaris TaxID=9615 RepID=UPI0015F1A197|nr:serine/arginine-rich splicing factor 7-like [Canis lupus familiaris]XP_038414005.1 serine/arginine-rich splicing factor 7-like [Canis lupus familiaris]XP_038543631.1 serine/arginine-rich splicing factor 7-like [Canis lupus familiaris]